MIVKRKELNQCFHYELVVFFISFLFSFQLSQKSSSWHFPILQNVGAHLFHTISISCYFAVEFTMGGDHVDKNPFALEVQTTRPQAKEGCLK